MYRLFEFFLALLLLLLLTPVLILTAAIIYITMGRPIFFSQQRPGLLAKPFCMYKFRSMQSGNAADSLRLTTVGKWLRKLSLDELPQLYNVLRGELSFVGPRPLLMEYLPLYSAEQARRHLVKPGITGWAQINGRNALSWDEKFSLDLWYVDNKSVFLDFKIMLLTALRVLQVRGIAHKDQVTMPKFTGTSQG